MPYEEHQRTLQGLLHREEYGELPEVESFIDSESKEEEEARDQKEEVKKQNAQKKNQERNQNNNLR